MTAPRHREPPRLVAVDKWPREVFRPRYHDRDSDWTDGIPPKGRAYFSFLRP